MDRTSLSKSFIFNYLLIRFACHFTSCTVAKNQDIVDIAENKIVIPEASKVRRSLFYFYDRTHAGTQLNRQ